MTRYVVNCDWFQVSVRNVRSLRFSHLDEIGNEVWSFKVLEGVEFNPYYARAMRVQYKEVDAFHLFLDPRHPEADKLDCALKVANRLLYCSDWADILRTFLRLTGFQVNHLQRVDICADFNYFLPQQGVRPLNPAKFIRDYFSPPTTRHDSYYRKGSNKFRAYGEKTESRIYFETLSFGSRESPVQVNLYNKSRELEVKEKPWIREAWQAAGLQDTKEVRVWRVEFSMNPQGMSLEHIKHDYFTELSLEQCATFTAINQLFVTLAQKYFVFYRLTLDHVKKGARVRTDRETPCKLFDFTFEPVFKHISLCKAHPSGVSERRALRTLERAARSTSDARERESLMSAAAVLGVISGQMSRRSADQLIADSILQQFLSSVCLRPDALSEKGRRRLIDRFATFLATKRPEVYDAMQMAFTACYKEVDAYEASVLDASKFLPPEFIEE